jgi:hypothetical protein
MVGSRVGRTLDLAGLAGPPSVRGTTGARRVQTTRRTCYQYITNLAVITYAGSFADSSPANERIQWGGGEVACLMAKRAAGSRLAAREDSRETIPSPRYVGHQQV